MLREMFGLVNADWENETPGMIAGQFFEATEGPGFFEVGYLDFNRAKVLLEAMGREPKLSDRHVTVLADVE